MKLAESAIRRPVWIIVILLLIVVGSFAAISREWPGYEDDDEGRAKMDGVVLPEVVRALFENAIQIVNLLFCLAPFCNLIGEVSKDQVVWLDQTRLDDRLVDQVERDEQNQVSDEVCNIIDGTVGNKDQLRQNACASARLRLGRSMCGIS